MNLNTIPLPTEVRPKSMVSTLEKKKKKTFSAMMPNIGVGHVRNHKEMGKAPNLKREIGSKLV
jgi:hypothetical protein